MRPLIRVKFDCSKGDAKLIDEAVERAKNLANAFIMEADMLEISMDITATHCNGNPLNLKKLLAFDDSNFAHDVFGIREHINRETGKLMDCFMPRCSYSQQEKLSLGI